MVGIYQGVKGDDLVLARECFTTVAQALQQRHGLKALIMGCTEIPLALQATGPMAEVLLVDPARLLARALAARAYAT
jgi:aspartate racemase